MNKVSSYYYPLMNTESLVISNSVIIVRIVLEIVTAIIVIGSLCAKEYDSLIYLLENS